MLKCGDKVTEFNVTSLPSASLYYYIVTSQAGFYLGVKNSFAI